MFDNIIKLTDSYKLSHYKQYPKDIKTVYSYFESRGGKFEKTLFFGLQYLLKRYFEGKVVTQEKINQAEKFANKHFLAEGHFNRDGWEYILRHHGGYLPIKIKAVPEGSLIPTSNVLITVENTDPKCFWLTNYVETLLVQTWYPITVATQSFYMKKIIARYLKATGELSGLEFKLHDFGFRGVSSVETAGIGGAAHLINFKGTDTVPGIDLADEYYDSDVCGYSIPATEHSTITSWGSESELEAYDNLLTEYPNGLLACVSDSYDIFKACSNLWGDKLKERVLARDGVLVIRPDSGEPKEILPKILDILGEKFGYTTNAKGYKVLHPKVRLIQGDGIEYSTLEDILLCVTQGGWSADNLAFGSGGGLLQKLNRDTNKFAFKCSAVNRAGQWFDVFKDPITDSGKTSKRGRLKLVKTCEYKTVSLDNRDYAYDELNTVFMNGNIQSWTNFDLIRRRAEKAFNDV